MEGQQTLEKLLSDHKAQFINWRICAPLVVKLLTPYINQWYGFSAGLCELLALDFFIEGPQQKLTVDNGRLAGLGSKLGPKPPPRYSQVGKLSSRF
jgi:hypothetical protein